MSAASKFIFAVLFFYGLTCSCLPSGKNPEKQVVDTGNGALAESDWPHWRGPDWTGISTERAWDPLRLKPENILWQKDLGRAYSSPVVANGRVYVQGRPSKHEILYCLDLLDGSILWQAQMPEVIEGSIIPQSTPTVDNGLVYFMSPHGIVKCLDALTGQPVWEKNLVRDLRVILPLWNFSSSVRIEGGLALVNAGFGVALDKNTGEVVWANEKGMCGYSTPVVFGDIASRHVVIGALDDVNVMDLKTGQILSTFPWKHISQQDTPADPLVTEKGILISTVMQRGAILVKMDEGGNKIVWKKREISNLSSYVYVDGFIYGNTNPNYGNSAGFDSEFFCMELSTGNKKWSKDSGLGTVIAVGDYLIRQGQDGLLEIGLIDSKDFMPVSEFKAFKAPSYSHPAFAHGFLITKNEAGRIVCLDLRNH